MSLSTALLWQHKNKNAPSAFTFHISTEPHSLDFKCGGDKCIKSSLAAGTVDECFKDYSAGKEFFKSH
jgi:hypothetical protein